MPKYLDKIAQMTEDNILGLDEIVLAALELFSESPSFSIPDSNFRRPVIVGSGNAKNTMKIIHDGQDVIFADENSYVQALDREWVDGVIIYSASGGKHAPIVAKYAREKGMRVRLVTCNPDSECRKILSDADITVTPKNLEPYTYNTSTYMGWILANTRENPKEILSFIENDIAKRIPANLADYNGFLLVLPNRFAAISSLLDVKFIELFGRNIARDIKTFEELKHAVTVVPSERELCIQFGEGEFYFRGNILHIPVPEYLWLAGIMAVGYYVIGKIQEQMHPYFREHIGAYIENLKKSEFGKGMGVIV